MKKVQKQVSPKLFVSTPGNFPRNEKKAFLNIPTYIFLEKTISSLNYASLGASHVTHLFRTKTRRHLLLRTEKEREKGKKVITPGPRFHSYYCINYHTN